ncbi:hypothetical protein FRB94_000789 [Tulasnella sp. JGI-2019a]|nr:hypothetical protein FRB94_000789 [Tulasnella sp. JGI-2019a]
MSQNGLGPLSKRLDKSPIRPASSGGAPHRSPESQPKSSRSRRPKSLNIVSSGNRRPASPLPPTVNNLLPETRADLMRKNRKLQQVLGAEYSHNPIQNPSSHRTVKSMDTNLGEDVAVASGEISPAGLDGSPYSWGRAYSKSKASASVLSMGEVLTTQKGQAHQSKGSATKPAKRSDRAPASLSHLSPNPGTPNSFMDLLDLSDGGEMSARTLISPTTPNNPPPVNPFEDSPDRNSTWAHTLNVSPDTKDTRIIVPEKELSEAQVVVVDVEQTPRAPAARLSPDILDSFGRVPRHTRPYARSSLVRSSSTPPVSPSGSFPSVGHLHPYAHGGRSHSAESFQTFLTTDVAEVDAAERKRRRDKLAKLHRFLGSNIPTGLVLGEAIEANDLPEASPDGESNEEGPGKGGKWWKGLQKSSAMSASVASQDKQQPKEPLMTESPLTEQDRVWNVKRKTKMEQMFGSNPPQSLYVLRSSSSVNHILESDSGSASLEPAGATTSHRRHDSTMLKSLEFLRHDQSLDSLKFMIENDDKESLKNLFREMTKDDPLEELDEEITFAPPEGWDEDEDPNDPPEIFHLRHRRHSSSAQLSAGKGIPRQVHVTTPLPSTLIAGPRSPSSAHILGSPTSPTDPLRSTSEAHYLDTVNRLGKRMSASSLFSLNLEAAPMDMFQQRRKRAAKLTKFFGTDYRSMFGEVLDSIEVGVLDDQTRGTLSEAEAAELLRKLRKIKLKPVSQVLASL